MTSRLPIVASRLNAQNAAITKIIISPRLTQIHISGPPWRMDFLVESEGHTKTKKMKRPTVWTMTPGKIEFVRYAIAPSIISTNR